MMSVSTTPDVENHSSIGYQDRVIDFEKKILFWAQNDITKKRSAGHKPRVIRKEIGIWDLKPPNFNPQAFMTKPPERNSRESMRPWLYSSNDGDEDLTKPRVDAASRKQNRRREEELIMMVREASTVQLPLSELESRPNFRVRFPPTDPFEGVRLVRRGEFVDIKPHDYRQYPDIKRLGLPEFTTRFPRDPMSLRFKAQRLNTLHGGSAEFFTNPANTVLKTYQEQQKSWDKGLMLPKEPFPNKYRAFSRHRRLDRSARSAFLERAEDMMRQRNIEVL